MSRHNRRAGHVDHLLGRNIRPETGDHVHMAFNEHDNDPGPLRSTLARADASPAPPARGPSEFAPRKHPEDARMRCPLCMSWHHPDFICRGEPDRSAEDRPGVPAGEATNYLVDAAIAALASRTRNGAGNGSERAVADERAETRRVDIFDVYDGLVEPGGGIDDARPGSFTVRLEGDASPAPQRRTAQAAIDQLAQLWARSCEQERDDDTVIAEFMADRVKRRLARQEAVGKTIAGISADFRAELAEADDHIRQLLSELAASAEREAGLRTKIDSMIGHAGRIAEIAKAPPKTGE